MEKIVLADDYYLTNFKTLLDFVFQRYEFLLTESEKSFYQRFYRLSCDGQMLLTRCYMRKGDAFRLAKLSYREISDRQVAAKELIAEQLAQPLPLDDCSAWIPLFTKAELVNQFQQTAWRTLKRDALNAQIAEYLRVQAAPKTIQDETILQISQENFDIYRLLFFGNLRQDLTEFVLQDLGMMAYENYGISDSHLAIQSRAEIAGLIDCHQLSDQFHDKPLWTPELLSKAVEQLPEDLAHAKLLSRRREKLLIYLGREFERQQAYQQAIALYSQTQRLPANERRIRCLQKLRPESAWQALQQLKRTTQSQQESQFVQVFEKKLARELGQNIASPPVYQPKEVLLSLNKTGETVELNVINYLVEEAGGEAIWAENSLFNTLFALIYWPLLFADVEGAFFNPFQMAPMDLYEPEFIDRRQAINEQLQPIIDDDEKLTQHILDTFAAKQGKACYFAHWQLVDEALLKQALSRIPMEHIRLLCRQILKDPRENRAGMPDLIYFPAGGGYELIEVKGPGDRLQNNQKIWMQFYHRHNIPHRLIRVAYVD